jgi:tRNA (guanine26-N2/guanine27-N2)-dimethyltransferase
VISVPDESMRRKSETFYNKEMVYQRDLTMSALRVYQREYGKSLDVCDPLAGTGIRSLRIALEVPSVGKIAANDANPKAFELIRKNLKSNSIDGKINIEITNENASRYFLDNVNGFDFIDIDPFGSPVNFIFNAGYALKPMSFLACTATDTGALCGTFPSTCFARYGIKSVKTDFFKETGIRALITAIMFGLSKHGLSFTPVYSHSNHYFRAAGKVRRSSSALSAQMKEVGLLVYCRSCLYRSFEIEGRCPNCGKNMDVIGPIWTGKIKDTGFCREMVKDLRSHGHTNTKELDTCVAEIDEPFYFELPSVFRVLKSSPVRMDAVLDSLKKHGYEASRTHLSDNGVKTNAPYEKVFGIVRELAGKK